MSKNFHFRGSFEKQPGKRAQRHLHSGRQNLYQLGWKKYLLVLCKILRLFVNVLSADDKHSLLNKDNLMQPIQMLLSQKQKTFSQFLSAFLKSTLNLEHFQKN